MYHPLYAVMEGWDTGHRFNMSKYHHLFRHLEKTRVFKFAEVQTPVDPGGDKWLHHAHCPKYVASYCDGSLSDPAIRRIGLPWSPAMVKAVRLEVAGTILAARLAVACQGISCNLGGGTHHGHWAHGSGFNPFNDLALAALTLLSEGVVGKVLIVDLDVHQGDGTAAILANKPQVTTFSMHSSLAFPVRKQQSDVDIPLDNNTSDAEYMRLLHHHLPLLLQNGEDSTQPDLVLYDAGVDVHEHDMVHQFCRGGLSLTEEGIRERDEFVLSSCLSLGIPVATVIGGGYSKDPKELTRRHAIHAETAVACQASHLLRST